MKGILLAGGTGSRLWPTTQAVSKHLIPIYDKPLIYYPLSTLMMAGVREICVITTPHDLPQYQNLLGSGSDFGLNLSFIVQENPDGIAQVFSITENFIGESHVCLILGDNLFHGMGLGGKLCELQEITGAHVFGYKVQNPESYGVMTFDDSGRLFDIIEKPSIPPSRYAVPGLYFYDNTVIERAKSLSKSERGEYEITDLNKSYLKDGELNYSILERGTMWLDCGTPNTLLAASNYVRTIEERQGLKIACPEEIAWRNGWISKKELEKLAVAFSNEYGAYLLSLLES
jgi:glucose-1-phosphate thymidylyltransferase